jgi:ABC-2 type transport system ATP-binding protein
MITLKIANLTKQFKNKTGINEITFTATNGECIGIIGNNGAGKTTLIKTILGNFKKSGGSITATKHDNVEVVYSYLPDQRSYPSDLSVYDYIHYYLVIKKIRFEKVKVNALLQKFGLDKVGKKRFSSLSSGMVKKVLLVAVLLIDVDIYFMDEPTANLDATTQKVFKEVIKILCQNGKIVLNVSHNFEELDDISTRIIVIKEGNLVADVPFQHGNSTNTLYSHYYYDDVTGARDLAANILQDKE